MTRASQADVGCVTMLKHLRAHTRAAPRILCHTGFTLLG